MEYCETIYEDYEYYCKNDSYDRINIMDNIINENNNVNGYKQITSLIVKVSSTTFITAILTYFILVVL